MARARAEGRVLADHLAATFDVTTQTIRRDLNELSQGGLLARVHDGAVPGASATNVDYAARRAGRSSSPAAASDSPTAPSSATRPRISSAGSRSTTP